MAFVKNDNSVKGVTPKGIFGWSNLFEPSYKFKDCGVYDVTLRLNGKDAEELQGVIDGIIEKEYKKAEAECKTPKQKAALKYADTPYKEETDDQMEPTGYTTFKFKCNASYVNKSGLQVKKQLAVFDSVGTPMQPVSVFGGTVGKIAYEITGFNTSALGVGASLRLEAVQIIKLVQGQASDAKGFGFTEEDGGFAQDAVGTSTEPVPFDEEEHYEGSEDAGDF
jgi:hypothetical protein